MGIHVSQLPLSPWVSWFWGMCLLSALRVSPSKFSPSWRWLDWQCTLQWLSFLPCFLFLLPYCWVLGNHLFSQGLFLETQVKMWGQSWKWREQIHSDTFAKLFFHIYLVIWLHLVLVTAGSFTYSMWDLVPWPRDQTQVPCPGKPDS